jgi:hypothetical protein
VRPGAELLHQARALMQAPQSGQADLAGVWPRAVALLGRQALEQALDAYWRQHAPGVEHASRLAQLLCLPAYLDDRDVASGVRYAWYGLSRACHHHAYELSPTAEELAALLDATDAFVSILREQASEVERSHLSPCRTSFS